MTITENEFFRQITLSICGSLDIVQALYRSFLFIRKHMPADRVSLSYFDPERCTIVVYASATLEGGAQTNVVIPLDDDQRRSLMDSNQFPDVLMLNRVAPGSIASLFLETMGHPEASLVSLRMRLDGRIQGNVTVIANGSGQFARQHVRLLSLLNEPFAVALSNSRRYRELVELKDLLADENRYLQQELRQMAGSEIVGTSPEIRRVMELVHQVAPQNSPVLIVGETGTGKELVARALHENSPRRHGPMIKVNCGAIPSSLMDSELFGHEKGAFTGATARKRGRFERAHTGTIFLDEVGELSPEAQVRLLRVLQDKEIERVGGTGPFRVDIRVVAATHRRLREMVEAGRFREDLYYRINVFPIEIPPLRKRGEDIEVLVNHFMKRKAAEMGLRILPALAPRALSKLRGYTWPGNVRELEHAVERALILNREGPLTFDELGIPESRQQRPAPAMRPGAAWSLDAVVADHIRSALEKTGGRIEGDKGAARLLGMNPGTLRYRMKKLGIPFGRRQKRI